MFMYEEKFTSAIKELKNLEKLLLVFATESCKSAQDGNSHQQKILYLRVSESWKSVIDLIRELEVYYDKGDFGRVTSNSIHTNMMSTEIGFLILFYDTEPLDSEREYLKNQVDLTRIAICNFLRKQEYDITSYKENYSTGKDS